MTGASENGRLIGGRYALEKIIGEGATGEVWRARHTALQSFVAIKFLHGSAAFRESTRKRFLKEAQVAARLNTRHAVQVFDFGVTEQGRPYLIMELLDGETLARRLVRLRRLTPAQTGHIMKLAARALERAHALGIVHRDFKPENIFLSEDEDGQVDVKVVDFGVAKLVGDLEDDRDDPAEPLSDPPLAAFASFTKTGARVGTPSYMSPEQAFARPNIGPAADIWAMGVVAYECLTGVRPFRAPTLEDLFDRIAKRSYAPAHQLCPDVPVDFDEWFRTACEPKAARRFPDAAMAAAALLEALGIQPNARALLASDSTGSLSRSARPFALITDQASAAASSLELRSSTSSSKPAPFVRTAPADPPGSRGRALWGAVVAGALALLAIGLWLWTARAPAQSPALATTQAPPSPPMLSSATSPAAPSAGVPSASAASSPLDAAPEAAPAAGTSRETPAKPSSPRPASTPTAATSLTAEPPPPASVVPPTPAPPPKPSATSTGPSSPFQLPDLGL